MQRLRTKGTVSLVGLGAAVCLTNLERLGVLRALQSSSESLARIGSNCSVRCLSVSPQRSAGASAKPTSCLSWFRQNPFLFQLSIATMKTSAADMMAQLIVERRETMDWRRNAVFVSFGFLYLGGFQYWLYVSRFTKWFPSTATFVNKPWREKLRDRPGSIECAKQIGFDSFVHMPFMYFPSFYLLKESLQIGTINPASTIPGAAQKYRDNFFKDQQAMLSVVFPTNIISFSAPLWLRLPIRHSVSFFWTCYLSLLRGSQK